jgi:hypothetical protein
MDEPAGLTPLRSHGTKSKKQTRFQNQPLLGAMAFRFENTRRNPA